MAALGAVGGAGLGAVGAVALCAPLGPFAVACAPVGAVVGGVSGAVNLGRVGAKWGAKAAQRDAPVSTSPIDTHDLAVQSARIEWGAKAAQRDAPVSTASIDTHDLAVQSARIGQAAAAEGAPSARDSSRNERRPEAPPPVQESALNEHLLNPPTITRGDADNPAVLDPAVNAPTAPAQPLAPPAANLGAREAGLGGLPAAGTAWNYRFSDRQYRRYDMNLTVRILRSGGAITEEVSGADVAGWQRRVLPKETRIVRHALGGGAELTEFAPYFFAGPEDALPPNASISGYPAGALSPWIVRIGGQRWEEIAVPAGSFRAWRVELSGTRERDDYARAQSGRFEMVVWYAPAVKRFVRLEHRTWSVGASRQSAHEVVELLSHRPPS